MEFLLDCQSGEFIYLFQKCLYIKISDYEVSKKVAIVVGKYF
jgi:hypothetical protein